MGLNLVLKASKNYDSNSIKFSKLRKIATPEREMQDIVTAFFVTYSKVSSWVAFKDQNLQTTSYMFEFHGLVWKARISFIHPFINYMAQVIGVNRRSMVTVSTLVP